MTVSNFFGNSQDIRSSRLTTGVVDTGGKFAAGIVDNGGKFAAGIKTTLVKLVAKFAAGVVDLELRISPRIFRKNSKRP
jgi:hypothetical protein